MGVSIDSTTSDGFGGSLDTVDDSFPRPKAHGAAVMNVLNDLGGASPTDPSNARRTLYDRALDTWRAEVGDRDLEPYTLVGDFEAEWLPAGDYALILKSSRWKAGAGEGDDYRSYYQQHLMLREVRENSEGERQLRKPPLALHVEIIPQFSHMVYESGDELEVPYGDGTLVRCSTTWAEDPREIERRMYDALAAAYGPDAFDVDDRNHDSRRISKAEAHIRFDIDRKGAAIETIEQSKHLIGWGGRSEIDGHTQRIREGWLEALFTSDRWDLLGFEDVDFDTELKLYQAGNWHEKPSTDPFHHPKLEASFSGAHGQLPHIDEWDDVLDHLRTVVATHAHWAGIEASDLVADDFYKGAASPEWEYERPTGRRQQLRARYKDVATEVYREALKETTTAVYDILTVVAEHDGATYDELEKRTGLARSTIRYHCARLAEHGVVKRLGNPVLVVFVSRALLDRAREILRECRPDDLAEDMDGRADERRERREQLEEERDEPDESDETGTVDADAVDDTRTWWEYLDRLDATIHDIAALVDRGELAERDVRVRADDLPPPLQ